MIESILNKNFGNKLSFSESKESKFKKEKDVFISIVDSLQKNIDRSISLYSEHNIDLFDYDAFYLEVIEDLFLLKYGPAISEIVIWYLYERQILNEEGKLTVLPLTLENNETKESEDLYLETSEQLWNFISKITSVN
jgi:hypothetical protein